MSKNTTNKQLLLGNITNGNKDYEICGFVVWWQIKNVDLSREQFIKCLEEVGIDKKYARTHNMRSAFTRALHSMEEDRIIRRVEENKLQLIFQFTAENKIDSAEGHELSYEKETLVVVNKTRYRETQIFSECLDCKPQFKAQLVALFDEHKDKYKSSDITRYLQLILKQQADIISLRDQGSVYFVPAGYQELLTKIADLLLKIGGSSKLEYLPIPNIESARNMIKTSLMDEVNTEFKNVEKDVEEAFNGDQAKSKIWTATRIERLQKMLSRLKLYSGGGISIDVGDFEANKKALEAKIYGVRRLDLGGDDEEDEELDVEVTASKNQEAVGAL